MYNRIHVCPYNPITTSARQSGNLCARPLNCLLHLPPKISNSRTTRMDTVSSTIYKGILVPTSLCFACMKLPPFVGKNRILFKLANTFRLSLEKCFVLAPPIFDISQLLTGSPGLHVPDSRKAEQPPEITAGLALCHSCRYALVCGHRIPVLRAQIEALSL